MGSFKPIPTEADRSSSACSPYEVLGWAHAEFCSAVDRGEDIRQMNVPDLIERFEADMPEFKQMLSEAND